MSGYRVIPMPAALADEARTTMTAPKYGHPAYAEVATDRAPCRVCLRRFTEWVDERLLFTYDPFEGLAAVPLPGPVYIHADRCEPSAAAIDDAVGRQLADEDVRYIHVRSATAGCFTATITR